MSIESYPSEYELEDGYYFRQLDLDLSEAHWRTVFMDYFGQKFESFQLQSGITPEAAIFEYQQLLKQLNQQDGELAALFRTARYGYMHDGGYEGTSSSYKRVEDVHIFQIDSPKLYIAGQASGSNEREILKDNNIAYGIHLVQPSVAYSMRSDYSRDWSIYGLVPDAGRTTFRYHLFEPLGNSVSLSWVDDYYWMAYPLPEQRGLEYANRTTRMPSMAYSPTTYNPHMKFIIGDSEVAEATLPDIHFDHATKQIISEYLEAK